MRHLTLGTRAAETVVFDAPTGGVDLSAPPHRIRADRLSEAVNLWVKDGHLTARPAVQERTWIDRTGMTVSATSLGRYAFLHGQDGNRHYFGLADERGDLVGSEVTLGGVRAVTALPHGTNGAALLLVDGDKRMLYSLQTDGSLVEETPTVPTLLIGGRATTAMVREDSGVLFEAPNLLGERFTCRYTTDGAGLYFWLPTGVRPDMSQPFSVSYTDLGDGTLTHTISAKDDGLWCESSDDPLLVDELRLCYNEREGCFWFRYAHGGLAAPLHATDVTITASLPSRREAVFGMRCGTWYGSRLFFAGSEESPNLLRWSASGNALYVPENNYAYVGEANEAITALAKQSDLLVIFKEHALYTTRPVVGTVSAEDLLTGEVTDTEATTAFPLSTVHPACGCDLPNTVCLPNDRLVWACSDGRVYTLISGGAYGVRSVRSVSAPIGAALDEYTVHQWRTATAATLNGHYLLMLGRTVYVLDGNDPSDQTAVWHVWELPAEGRLTEARKRALFITDEAVHTFEAEGDDRVGPIESSVSCRLTTRHEELGDALSYKRLQKLMLWVTGAYDDRLSVQVDGQTAAELRLNGKPLENQPPYVIPLGGQRVRRAAVTLTASGRLTFDRFGLTYRKTGEMTE